MNEQDLVDNIVDQYLAFLDGEAPEPSLDQLSPTTRLQVMQHLADLEALHGQLVPDESHVELADDPVWRNLGFDRVGTSVEIDGRKLNRLRKAAAFTMDQLVQYIRNGGGQLSVSDLFRLENTAPPPYLRLMFPHSLRHSASPSPTSSPLPLRPTR